MISVIVPTCNEEQLLPGCLDSVSSQGVDCQLIVSDGGSTDDTLKIGRRYTDLVITRARPNLAKQLNAGASLASGHILLFLHADSRLFSGCLARLECLPEKIVGGAFTMQLGGNRLFYRLLALGGNMYCRFSRTYFGDRGIFVRTRVFNQMGGYAELPIMSDVEFSRRLKSQGKTVLLPGQFISSSRKFEQERAWRSLYLIFYALIAFRLKVDPAKIKNMYYGKK